MVLVRPILIALLVLAALPRQEFFFGLIVVVIFFVVIVEFVQTIFELFGTLFLVKMCYFAAYHYILCSHIDSHLLHLCADFMAQMQRIQDPNEDPHQVPFDQPASCDPRLPNSLRHDPGNISRFHTVLPHEVGPTTFSTSQIIGQIDAHQQSNGTYSDYGAETPSAPTSHVYLTGLCSRCTLAAERLAELHQREPLFGLTDEMILDETKMGLYLQYVNHLRNVVEVQGSTNPFSRTHETLDFPQAARILPGLESQFQIEGYDASPVSLFANQEPPINVYNSNLPDDAASMMMMSMHQNNFSNGTTMMNTMYGNGMVSVNPVVLNPDSQQFNMNMGLTNPYSSTMAAGSEHSGYQNIPPPTPSFIQYQQPINIYHGGTQALFDTREGGGALIGNGDSYNCDDNNNNNTNKKNKNDNDTSYPATEKKGPKGKVAIARPKPRPRTRFIRNVALPDPFVPPATTNGERPPMTTLFKDHAHGSSSNLMFDEERLSDRHTYNPIDESPTPKERLPKHTDALAVRAKKTAEMGAATAARALQKNNDRGVLRRTTSTSTTTTKETPGPETSTGTKDKKMRLSARWQSALRSCSASHASPATATAEETE